MDVDILLDVPGGRVWLKAHFLVEAGGFVPPCCCCVEGRSVARYNVSKADCRGAEWAV